MDSPSSSCSSLVAHHNFDAYVSSVVGFEVATGCGVIELSEDFKRQLEIDLKEQEIRFAEEDRKLSLLRAELAAKRAAASSSPAPSASTASTATAAAASVEFVEEDDADFDESLLEIDPADYRKADLYAVLGLSKRRFVATPEEIKLAYRARVVKHHPDKLKQNPRAKPLKNPNLEDDSFFKLIQKAYQVMTDPTRRADYDACDPTFDESIPEDRDYSGSDEESFYATYAPVFQRNARFSKKQPVPELGDASTPRAQVEAFYQFWIVFESTRRFEWLDEEEPAGTENRADKRWHEKKNKAQRDKRKREDNIRLIRLTEQAMKRDPRMIRWKEADKQAKNAKKNAKAEEARRLAEAEAARKAADSEARARAEAEAKAAKEAAAAQKASAKAALKASRKAFRDAIGCVDQWSSNLAADSAVIAVTAQLVDKVVAECAEDTARLDRVTQAIQSLAVNKSLTALRDLLQSVTEGNQVEGKPAAEPVEPAKLDTTDNDDNQQQQQQQQNAPWTVEELDLLINAAKTFPGGTPSRWERITEQINRQLHNVNPSARQFSVQHVIKRANELQAAKEAEERDAAQAKAALEASKKKRDPRVDQATPTVASHYFSSDADRAEEAAKENVAAAAAPVSLWTPEDQLALESALKAVPADDANRWERVAALVPGKSKKDCIQRVKEIAQMLKSRQ